MTKAEMSQLQEVAKKYSQYGYDLFKICELMNEQPKELSFKRKLDTVRFTLSHICDCSEYFTLDEMAALLEIEPEELWNFIQENNIGYRIVYTPRHKGKGRNNE